MTITKALADAGVVINHYNKPSSAPTKDKFARVIHALRDAEAASEAFIKEQGLLLDGARKANLELTKLVQELSSKVQKHELKEKLEGDAYSSLTVADKNNLISVTD